MLRLVSDEQLNGDVIRGLLRRQPDLDLVRAVDVGLQGATDPAVLDWAAQENRVLLSEDRETMIGFTWARVAAGKPMPGLLVVRPKTTIGEAIEACSSWPPAPKRRKCGAGCSTSRLSSCGRPRAGEARALFHQRPDVPVDCLLVCHVRHARVQLPRLGQLDRAARRQGDDRPQGL